MTLQYIVIRANGAYF